MDKNKLRELASIVTEASAFNQQDKATGYLFHDAKVVTTDNTGHLSKPHPVDTIIVFPQERFAVVSEAPEVWKCWYQGTEGDAFVIAYREKLNPAQLADLIL